MAPLLPFGHNPFRSETPPGDSSPEELLLSSPTAQSIHSNSSVSYIEARNDSDMDYNLDTLTIFDALVERFEPHETVIATISISPTEHVCVAASFNEAENLILTVVFRQLNGIWLGTPVWDNYCQSLGLESMKPRFEWSDIAAYGGTMLGPFRGKGPEWTAERVLTRLRQKYGGMRIKLFEKWYPHTKNAP